MELSLTLDPKSLSPQVGEFLQGIIAPIVRREVTAALAQQSPKPDTGEGLPRDTTAAKIGCSLVTLRELEKRRKLVPYRVGRKVMYRRSDVEAFMAGRQ